MKVKKIFQTANDYPVRLKTIAQPPAQLFVRGHVDRQVWEGPSIAVVGSRKATAYGKAVTATLAGELAKAGILIISGLALGVDGWAHQAALDAGGRTVAIVATGLDRLYPSRHRQLAERIVAQGGALITEYEPGASVQPGMFIARNRIVAALADGVLVTEAAVKSGTLHTARFALEQGKEVFAVPGNITSPSSAGTNNLIRSGAVPVTRSEDILHVFGWSAPRSTPRAVLGDTAAEQSIIDALQTGASDAHQLQAITKLDTSVFNQSLIMLEIAGKIRPLGNNHWAVY